MTSDNFLSEYIEKKLIKPEKIEQRGTKGTFLFSKKYLLDFASFCVY